MSNKKTIFIALGSVAVIVVGLLVYGFFTKDSKTEDNGFANVDANTELSEGERAQILSYTEEFVSTVGNYGWYPDVIKNADLTNASAVYSLYNTDKVGPEQIIPVLRKLSNSQNFDDQVNTDIFGEPFFVESSLNGEIVVPRTPQAEGSLTVVSVTVPMKSSLSFISAPTAADGSPPVFGITTVDKEGDLVLKFRKKGENWYVDSFSSTVGLLVLDGISVVNGEFIAAGNDV